MHKAMFVISLLLLTALANSIALCAFILEELKSLKYEVDILKPPIKSNEDQLNSVLHMTTKYGQQYQCNVPYIEENEGSDQKVNAEEMKVDIKELLKPIHSGSCLLRAKDWWTYEFCFGQYVKQYHIEDGKIIGHVITLGLYESDYDWNNQTDNDKFRHSKQRYHSQMYTNGSRCDLTGLPRTAEVRFFCEEDAGDYIYRVDEPGTCSYVLAVHTGRICSHPLLKPSPTNKIHKISCSPLLSDDQYEVYLQNINGQKSTAESQRSKWLNDQQEQLKGLHLDEKDKISEDSATKDNAQSGVKQTLKDDENDRLQKMKAVHEAKINEYNEEIKKLKAVIPASRYPSVKDNVQKEFDSIISEAEEELDGNINDDSKDAAFSKLADTLNILLNKLDKVEKDVTEAAVHLEEVQSAIGSKSHENKDSNNIVSNLDSNADTAIETGRLKVVDGDESRSAILDDDKLHVRIRRLDRKSTDSNGELQEMDFAQRKRLEKAIKEKLEKSGLDTGGRRIEVKIITAGYYDNDDTKDFHSLSDDETSHFQHMIMALLTGQQEAIQEMERHKKLEENYRFVWGPNTIQTEEED